MMKKKEVESDSTKKANMKTVKIRWSLKKSTYHREKEKKKSFVKLF